MESAGGTQVTSIDYFALKVPTNKLVVLHEVRLGQGTDAGDAEAEMLQVTMGRYDGSDGTGGTSPIPERLDPGDALAATVLRVNDVTTGATGVTEIFHDTWNVQAGWLYLPTPETRIIIPGGTNFVVRTLTIPADPLTISATLTFEEIG